MSKIPNLELMGWRELTEAELGFLMTTRNYGGALILKFIALGKDAAAIDMHDHKEAEELLGKLRRLIIKVSLQRQLQVYQQANTLIISKARYGEDLKLTKEQEVVFR
jgi:hypothetical protein